MTDHSAELAGGVAPPGTPAGGPALGPGGSHPPWRAGRGGTSRPVADRILAGLAGGAALLVAAALIAIVGSVLAGGASRLSWSFLLEAPRNAGRAGGIGPVIVSTTLILGVCLAAALPVGIGTAVLMAELVPRGSRAARLVGLSLDVLAGVPSIVFGLFGSAFFCLALGLGFSILSGGLTLACMILPVLVRAVERGLRAVPDELRHAGAALALSRGRLIRTVLLPAAAPAVAAGLLLGTGRALSETAALLFTSGYVARWPESLLDSGRALSVHIYDLAMNVPGGEPGAHGTALVLVGLLLVIQAGGHWLTTRLVGARVSS